ncbi:HAMP domain-containing sensor histidine kinase [Anaerorhabdus sp.]|uniref:HAMP domain-containing sensor histidine kinase n=1 Tax=Anaerorhabdus sp. TaxID=1872524 RepID=UPI002FC6FC79
MKRLRIWIKELSLSQQLLTIIFFVIAVFGLFFFVFLADSVDTFVQNEMYKMLHRSQESVVFYANNNIPLETIGETNDSNIIHIYYNSVKSRFQILGQQNVTSEVISDISLNIPYVKEGYKDFIFEFNNKKTMYSILKLNEDNYLISLVTDAYRTEFRAALVNSVINLNVLVVGILFVILMLWVASLIYPLNQIRIYMERIRRNEKAELKIDRRDEIGEVADALTMMEAELDNQKKIREEMIQNISHDLKTPIATIKSYGESIKDGIYPYETLEKSVDVIIEHANRLEKKVYSLIMYNKMGYLLDNDEDSSVDMKSIIEKVIMSLKVIRPEIKIDADLHEAIFHGEEEPWRIVVENLLDNALRYAKTEIKLTLSENELMISNDGSQMSKDRLEKLFRPYEKGTDGKFGLGLSIVYRVCSTYSYLVEAENLTNGVCFRISRPQSKKEKKKIIKDEKKEEPQS